MKSAVLSLAQSRKFWLTAITIAAAFAAYFRHGIDASQLANIMAASSGVLVLAIAHEDNGKAQGGASLASTLEDAVASSGITPPPLPSGDVSALTSAEKKS